MSDSLAASEKRTLLEISRKALTLYVKEGRRLNWKNDNPAFEAIRGLFVTLHKTGRLRGCIGNIVGTLPIYKGLIEMTIAAASQDPRFSPVRDDELAEIDIEISLLTPLQEINDPHEIIMGKHGVLVKDGLRSGVYLPQVALETGWSRDEFMNSLCSEKAGMAADAWCRGNCRLYTFTAEVLREQEM
jgi:AmmeMemoRadiSam system protein A